MAEYQLYCFAHREMPIARRLMLNLIGAEWEPIWVDFSLAVRRARRSTEPTSTDGRSAGARAWRQELAQSGVILTYLAERSGNSCPQ